MSPFRFPARTPAVRAGWLALACALLLGLATATPAQEKAQEQAQSGRIAGAIAGAPPGVQVAGARVVLVQFKLDDKGVPSGKPIQNAAADAKGAYRFENVPIEPHTVYQVGATVGGQIVGSQPFTFPAGQREMQLDLHYPHLVSDAGAVRIEEGLIAVEARRGSVWVTEVLHLVNPGQDVIEGIQRPMELDLPVGAEHLEIVRELQAQNGHEQLGRKLLVYGNLEPGNSTVAYRYQVPVWLGTVELDRSYPHPIKTLSVLSPVGELRLLGQQFQTKPEQTIDNARFNAWAATDIPAGQRVTVRMSGVPIRQAVYLIPSGGFAVLMVGVVVWFLRRRLRGEDETASA